MSNTSTEMKESLEQKVTHETRTLEEFSAFKQLINQCRVDLYDDFYFRNTHFLDIPKDTVLPQCDLSPKIRTHH